MCAVCVQCVCVLWVCMCVCACVRVKDRQYTAGLGRCDNRMSGQGLAQSVERVRRVPSRWSHLILRAGANSYAAHAHIAIMHLSPLVCVCARVCVCVRVCVCLHGCMVACI